MAVFSFNSRNSISVSATLNCVSVCLCVSLQSKPKRRQKQFFYLLVRHLLLLPQLLLHFRKRGWRMPSSPTPLLVSRSEVATVLSTSQKDYIYIYIPSVADCRSTVPNAHILGLKRSLFPPFPRNDFKDFNKNVFITVEMNDQYE